MSMNKQSTNQSAIEKLIEESEDIEIEMLNSESLKKLLLSFEKKINKNQKLRMKYPDEPEKFMDSEVELHEELNNLYAISASPELYPTFVQAGSVQVRPLITVSLLVLLCIFVWYVSLSLCRLNVVLNLNYVWT